MTNFIIPDLTFLDNDNQLTFESSKNIVCYQQTENGCEVIFNNKPSRFVKRNIVELSETLKQKGLFNLNNRLLFKMNDLAKILKEDFRFHIIFNSKKKIEISDEEASFLMDQMIKI